jgi:hypothetical protein
LFEAVQNDGVEYLAPLEDRWGEIAQCPDLIAEYDRKGGRFNSNQRSFGGCQFNIFPHDDRNNI